MLTTLGSSPAAPGGWRPPPAVAPLPGARPLARPRLRLARPPGPAAHGRVRARGHGQRRGRGRRRRASTRSRPPRPSPAARPRPSSTASPPTPSNPADSVGSFDRAAGAGVRLGAGHRRRGPRQAAVGRPRRPPGGAATAAPPARSSPATPWSRRPRADEATAVAQTVVRFGRPVRRRDRGLRRHRRAAARSRGPSRSTATAPRSSKGSRATTARCSACRCRCCARCWPSWASPSPTCGPRRDRRRRVRLRVGPLDGVAAGRAGPHGRHHQRPVPPAVPRLRRGRPRGRVPRPAGRRPATAAPTAGCSSAR